jgi:glutathione S-transferase
VSAASEVALIDEALALRFPGGSVVKAKPSREAMEDSALAWAQTCNSNLHSLIDELMHGDTRMAAGGLRGLEASVVRLRAVFDELEKA